MRALFADDAATGRVCPGGGIIRQQDLRNRVFEGSFVFPRCRLMLRDALWPGGV